MVLILVFAIYAQESVLISLSTALVRLRWRCGAVIIVIDRNVKLLNLLYL